MKGFETKITIQELKHCPWCGKLPIVDVEENVIIMCPDARVRMLDFHEMGGRCPSPSCIIEKTLTEALSKWNGARHWKVIDPLLDKKAESLMIETHLKEDARQKFFREQAADIRNREAYRKNKELFDYAATINSPWHDFMDGGLAHRKLIEMITAVEIALVGGKK